MVSHGAQHPYLIAFSLVVILTLIFHAFKIVLTQFTLILCALQLLQNIVKSTELNFPPDIKDLSSDCKDLCQKLLRRNPGMSHDVCV